MSRIKIDNPSADNIKEGLRLFANDTDSNFEMRETETGSHEVEVEYPSGSVILLVISEDSLLKIDHVEEDSEKTWKVRKIDSIEFATEVDELYSSKIFINMEEWIFRE